MYRAASFRKVLPHDTLLDTYSAGDFKVSDLAVMNSLYVLMAVAVQRDFCAAADIRDYVLSGCTDT